MLSRLGHPLDSSMETKPYGYKELMLVDTKRATTRQVTPWSHTEHHKERRWAFVFTKVIFWYQTGLFLFCSRDKVDRHTPILIEDENLFTAFDDLLLDDTWNKRDPEPYQDINVLLFLGLGENPQINLLGQVITQTTIPTRWWTLISDIPHIPNPCFPPTDDLSPL